MDEVWKDSCVEFFIQPRPDAGYFNLEMNAGGAHLCCYIEDPARVRVDLRNSHGFLRNLAGAFGCNHRCLKPSTRRSLSLCTGN